MNPRIPEKHKTPGVCYAVTGDGIELPVVDITHDAFTLSLDSEEVLAIAKHSLHDLQRAHRIPFILQKIAAYRSILMRATMEASGRGLSGMGTYLLKLGPANLGEGYAGRLDRKIASSIVPVCIRLRLQAIAQLTTEFLSPLLKAKPNCPLHLVNIAGGPSADSLNTLIMIRKQQPELLANRRISVHVLDIDHAGPLFGKRALAALLTENGPLHGPTVAMEHIGYNWRNVSALRKVLKSISAETAVVVGSSEGGLFEYGTDEDILANLKALREGADDDFFFVGSIVRDERVARTIKKFGNLTLQTLGLDAFKHLAAGAGWEVQHVIEVSPLYHVFSLKKV